MFKLPKEKERECREVFNLFDKDGGGSISTNELGDVMKFLGANPSSAELDAMRKELDTDNSGNIEFAEFLNLFAKTMAEPDSYEDLLDAFKIFDINGNGTLSAKELRKIMITCGDKMTEEEVSDFLRKAPRLANNPEEIDYKAYAKTISAKISQGEEITK